MSIVNAIDVRGDNKSTRSVRSVYCINFVITGGKIPSIKGMKTNKHGLKSMSDIVPKILITSSKMWGKKGLVSIGRFDDDENAEAMMKRFVNLPAQVITQSVSRIHEEFAKCFYAEYFKDSLAEKDCLLAQLHGIQECFIIIQN